MGQIKVGRVRQKIKAEVARIIMTELNDPRAGFVTVQSVELTQDFRHAKINVSIMGADAERRKIMRMLEGATGFIQRAVAGMLRTRVTPALHFVHDLSVDKSFKVAAILDEIKKQQPPETLERSAGLEDSAPELEPEADDAEDEDEDEDSDSEDGEDEAEAEASAPPPKKKSGRALKGKKKAKAKAEDDEELGDADGDDWDAEDS